MLKKLTLLFVFSLPLLASAGETGTALKTDSLRAEPFADAKIKGNLNRGDAVEILGKQGAWLNIKAPKASGWVRILSVKRGAAAGKSNSTSDVLNVASGRAGTGNVVATTGVRGLSSEELNSAQFNDAEVKLLESQSQSPEQAKQFATEAGLKSVSMSYLPAPAK